VEGRAIGRVAQALGWFFRRTGGPGFSCFSVADQTEGAPSFAESAGLVLRSEQRVGIKNVLSFELNQLQ